MRLNRRIILQLVAFGVVAVVGAAVMLIGYVNLPSRLFGVDRYTVTVDLPESAGIYVNGNVTYRGTEVGQIRSVELTDTGVAAVLSLDSRVPIPSDLDAGVNSVSALGEQYIALLPRNSDSSPLRNGAVIPRDRTSVPVPIDTLLATANSGLEAIPKGNLKTVIDESFTAVGGLGPELSRIVDGSTALAIDADAARQQLNDLIDKSPRVLQSQVDSADSIAAWANNLASVTNQMRNEDNAVRGILETGASAADEARSLLERLKPTLPLLLANLVSIDQVGITYQPNIEQALVLAPLVIAEGQAFLVPSRNVPGTYNAANSIGIGLNLNLPPPCTTGFLPAQQRLDPTLEEAPERLRGDLYCRIPQDSAFGVRGVRNIPCASKPGKRAPTAKMCESDEEYVPLNDGFNWKGDPNATLSGQDIPQLPPGAAPASAPPNTQPGNANPALPVAIAQYDPSTGGYIGPDGKLYNQSDLAKSAPDDKSWQSMLTPEGQ